MTVLSVDPGKNIGVALWKDDGTLLHNTEVSVEDFLEFLSDDCELSVIVIENWRLRTRQMQQTGSKMEASQIIGAVRLYGKIHHIPVVLQDPQVMRITAMHFDIPLTKGHIPDKTAALLHGLRYFNEREVLKPNLQR